MSGPFWPAIDHPQAVAGEHARENRFSLGSRQRAARTAFKLHFVRHKEASMFRTHTPAELLDQQASLLAARLDGVYDGDVNAVHDARIATRRIRELLALVPLVPGRDPEEDPAARY